MQASRFPAALFNDDSRRVHCSSQIRAEIDKQLETLFGYMADVRRERRKRRITVEEYSSSLKSLRLAMTELLEIREMDDSMRS